MRIRKLNLKSTFFSLLGYVGASPEPAQPRRLEALRAAMLATLGEAGCEQHTRVARKLRYAEDVQGLWYARSELMAALAALHGEAHARREIERLSAQFRGLLPHGMTTGNSRFPG